jgi:hypothetical protein
MLNLSTVSTLLGAAFGLRFGVFILVPVMALELGFVAVNGFAIGETAGRLAIAMSLVATSVQLGYLGGSIVGFLGDRTSVQTSARMSGPSNDQERGKSCRADQCVRAD